MLRFAVDLKAKTGSCAPEICQKYPEIEVFGVNDPLSEKNCSSVPKEFMTTWIHVLCSNFTELDRRKLCETMRCLVTKRSENAAFSLPFCARLVEGTKSLQDQRAT